MTKETINLNYPKNLLTEKVYSKFAGQVMRTMLMLYDAGFDIPLSITGRPEQVSSFMSTLKKEKKYMDSYIKHGLNDSRTLMSRHKLLDSVKAFEGETGLVWPFKN